MTKDKRKALRRAVRYTAWIALEDKQLHGCVLSDVSDTGARIDIDETKTLADHFTLFLSSNGSARRKCKVVWRKPNQIGVTFEYRLNEAEHATLVPKIDPDHGVTFESVEADPAERT
jgi:PilZ domain